MSEILEVRDLVKHYQMGEVTVKALEGDSFDVIEGEFIVVLGPSGSGKSTLLNILGGMDKPTSGSVTFRGEPIHTYDDKRLTGYRRERVGFVFQFYNLMANLTARENVELATEICRDPLSIDEVMADVGLTDRAGHFPSQMSGGEQQRVAIARAVAKNPDLLLCDEPTGALDYETGIKILKLLAEVNQKYGKTVMVITHNAAIGRMADRVIKMRSGKITDIHVNEEKVAAEGIEW
jgi:putative ABC transport system ATP-binding protein